MRRGLVAIAAVLAACSSTSGDPAVVGRGIVSVDATPPDGARVWSRPTLRTGDRFVFRTRGLVDISFRVQAATDAGYVLEEETTGLLNRFTPDLGALGQDLPNDPSAMQRFVPFVADLSWPMWVGKSWSCHYVRESATGDALPLLARYECDALETIRVGAGEFECLRIWRRTRPAIDREYFEKCDLFWYAPGVGFFVRKLEAGALTELQELHRQS